MIFPGVLQRPAMQFYSVVWNKVRSKIILKLISLIELGEHIAQRHTPATQNFAKNATKRDKTARTMICQFFNQGSCMHQATHETKGVIYKHVCNYCFTKNGKSFPHSEMECQNKSKNTKNE